MLSALKNFGVTFLIAAIIFGTMAYFVVGFVIDTMNNILDEERNELEGIIQNPENEGPEQNPDSSINDPNEEEIHGDSFNFIVITTDYRPDIYDNYSPNSASMSGTDWSTVDPEKTTGCLTENYRDISVTSIVLVRIDKEREQYVYSYISPYISVYTSSGYKSLSEVYNFYGKNTLVDYVNFLTGIKPKYTLLLDGYNMDDLTALLGDVRTTLPKDIYTDGNHFSMQYETTKTTYNDNGDEEIEHIPNTFVFAKGDIYTTGENLYKIMSVVEHSISDIKAKEAYAVDLISQFISALAQIEEEDQKIVLAKLITKESEWINIDPPEIDSNEVDSKGESESEPESESESENDSESEALPEDPEEEPEIIITWKPVLGEPEDPIINTNYTMNEFEEITDLISAIDEFETVIITYPCTFVKETETREEHFSADVQAALGVYAPYKLINIVTD